MQVPRGWSIVDVGRTRRWVHRLPVVAADGQALTWSSWHHRRGLGLLERATDRRLASAPADAMRRARWIGSLFFIGSVCFAAGSVPAFARSVPGGGAWVFFVGSIFFTSAAYLQFHEAANAGDDLEGLVRTRRWARWRAESIGWWASGTQLGGTVAFNVSTLAAVFASSRAGEVAMVWAPDVLGSVAFLIAGELALLEFCGRLWCVRGTAGWWVAFVNAIGAVAFAVAAVAARVTPSGEVANTGLVNSSTFIGAVCFAAGAALLPAAVRGVGEGGPGPGAAS